MGYKQATLNIDLSDLGDGCFVTIRNPKLMSFGDVDQDATDPTKANDATKRMLAKLVIAWKMWDINDDSVELALPSADPTVLDKCPIEIYKRIGEAVTDGANPQ